MGVDRHDYIVYGFKMPSDHLESKGIIFWENDTYLPFIEGWKGEDYAIIDDQMCGKYCVFGYKIASASEQGFDFTELPSNGWPVNAEQVKAKFTEVFGFSSDEFGEPKVLVFSHFS